MPAVRWPEADPPSSYVGPARARPSQLEPSKRGRQPAPATDPSTVTEDRPSQGLDADAIPPGWDDERPTEPGIPESSVAVHAQPVLVRMEGPEAGRVYSLSRCTLTVGRSTDSDIAIDDSGVSRHHLCLGVFGQSVYVEDMGSENGTYVNERRIRRVPLQSGDLVQLGARVAFSFQWVNGAHLKLIEQLYSASTRDGLTGVHNRRHFEDRLQAEVAFSRRHGTDLGLVMLDIDYFKSFNDRHGHPVGDAVLQQLASRIVRQVRTEDVFARIGGEEFAVLLRGINIEGCCRLAVRLRTVTAGSPFRIDNLTLPVTISLGCASLNGSGVSAKALIASADVRLYQAKRDGRNRVVPDDTGS